MTGHITGHITRGWLAFRGKIYPKGFLPRSLPRHRPPTPKTAHGAAHQKEYTADKLRTHLPVHHGPVIAKLGNTPSHSPSSTLANSLFSPLFQQLLAGETARQEDLPSTQAHAQERPQKGSQASVMAHLTPVFSPVSRAAAATVSTSASAAEVETLSPSLLARSAQSTLPTNSTAKKFPLGTAFDGFFRESGERHGISPALLAAVARAESSLNPRAVSPAGAQGLMQLMPGTARELGVRDPFHPAQAIEGAARYLSAQLHRFGSVEKALAAYNAGPGNVLKYQGVPPFSETEKYIARITTMLKGTA